MSGDRHDTVDTKALVPLAILFGDVKGSTADAEHDERAAVAMLREYVHVATSTAERSHRACTG
jgi:class 3 adenylate cyclase